MDGSFAGGIFAWDLVTKPELRDQTETGREFFGRLLGEPGWGSSHSRRSAQQNLDLAPIHDASDEIDTMTRSAGYEQDVIAWANEQARLLRAGEFDRLDIEHLAEEIEDVGKSEQRELASRMAALLTNLLKWQYQSERHGSSWQRVIRAQRRAIALRLKRTPSLKTMLCDSDWWEEIWADAMSAATTETGLDTLPENCPWSQTDILEPDWLPE